jgi:glycosyltransferase involved in cell wall biosynthesis
MNRERSLDSGATVALLPWGDVFEDWLDPLGVTLDSFRTQMTGSWIFGYVDALATADARTVVVCVTARVDAPMRTTHVPTGAALWFLPSTRTARAIRGAASRRISFPGAGPLARRLSQQGAPYLATPLRQLGRVLRSEGARVVLCQDYENPRFDVCVLLGRCLGLRVFGTFQSGAYSSRVEWLARRLAVASSAGLIIAARRERERVRRRYGVPPERLARIFNPIDVSLWRPVERAVARAELGIPLETRVAVWHGRLDVHRKGLDLLLDAWSRLADGSPQDESRLLLVGSGEGAEEIRRLIAAKHLDSVSLIDRWVHDRTELRRYLSAGDVYAFASRHEGLPVAVLEAMACGLPVVAADCQGVSDILEGGEAAGGLVVPREDATALARALARFLHDRELARRLGANARARAESSFSLEAVGEQLRAFMLDRAGSTDRRFTARCF